jgi:hypothetical protein
MAAEKSAGGYVSASVERGKAKSQGKKVLSSISIEPSQNGGFAVSQRYRLERGNDGMGYCEPETYTFESADSLFAHLKATLGGGAKSGK